VRLIHALTSRVPPRDPLAQTLDSYVAEVGAVALLPRNCTTTVEGRRAPPEQTFDFTPLIRT